jgi:hypothetical protein
MTNATFYPILLAFNQTIALKKMHSLLANKILIYPKTQANDHSLKKKETTAFQLK